MDLTEEVELVEDFKQKTLNWAAALEPSHPSPRLEFLKNFLSILSEDEIKRLRKMAANIKRRLKSTGNAQAKKTKTSNTSETTETSPAIEAATSSSDAVNSSVAGGTDREIGWWEKFEEIAFDTEFVKKIPEGNHEAATVAVVDTSLKPMYETNVYHPRRSFEVNGYTKQINGFRDGDFDNRSYPILEDVKSKMHQMFIQPKRLIVTLGGSADYAALNLSMGDYEYFDLQTHWYREVINEHGVLVRENLSLATLAKYYLNKDIQQGLHTALEDATVTMELFHVYKRIKKEGDPTQLQFKSNNDPYNFIPNVKRKKLKKPLR